mgnify:CR=1 FL=1
MTTQEAQSLMVDLEFEHAVALAKAALAEKNVRVARSWVDAAAKIRITPELSELDGKVKQAEAEQNRL